MSSFFARELVKKELSGAHRFLKKNPHPFVEHNRNWFLDVPIVPDFCDHKAHHIKRRSLSYRYYFFI